MVKANQIAMPSMKAKPISRKPRSVKLKCWRSRGPPLFPPGPTFFNFSDCVCCIGYRLIRYYLYCFHSRSGYPDPGILAYFLFKTKRAQDERGIFLTVI